MALTNICKSYRMSNYLCSALRNSLTYMLLRNKSMPVELDALDDFTRQLMQKKANKWENLKTKRELPVTTQIPITEKEVLGTKLNEITVNELNITFEELLDENDNYKIYTLLEECIAYRKIPSDLILTNLLSYFSQIANAEGIEKIHTLCSVANPEYLKANSSLKHYLAEIMWSKGNPLRAIEVFEEVYQENPFLRRRIRLMLKNLMSDAVSNRSEAVLVNLIKLTKNLVKKYKDYYPMSCLWQTCFLSEWFSDQTVAFNLLETDSGLFKVILNYIPYVVTISLNDHKTDPVHRLLEILLKHDMKFQYSIVLVALFDYRYRQNDLRSCCEILNWSTKHKIMLPSIQHENFLKLLLNCNISKHKHKHSVSKCDFKF